MIKTKFTTENKLRIQVTKVCLYLTGIKKTQHVAAFIEYLIGKDRTDSSVQ